MSAGYFLWDAAVCLYHIRSTGIGFALHGVACTIAYAWSQRPFVHYWAVLFLLYELSTPFLNTVWFMDKMGYTGSKRQLVAGIGLLITFFVIRLCCGFYWTLSWWTEIYQLLVQNAADYRVPYSQIFVIVAANAALNALNLVWFYKMVDSVRKRFLSADKRSL